MPPLEEYLANADDLAQHVLYTWGLKVQSGNAALFTTQFKALFDKASVYLNARKLADSHREHSVLSEQDESQEKATREAFALAYKAYYERHAAIS